MKTCHVMTVDLPVGPADLGAEVEVIISFTFDSTDITLPAVDFVAVLPVHPFSGVFADLEQIRLEDNARHWFERPDGQERAFKQVEIDREEI